ncbi:STE3-domain-containing protein [Peniophora sp. CONT]|nr:STE3-domain-containing protein [Peniophora sp. CONT]
MQDPTYPLVPIASIFAVVLVLLTFVTSGYRGAFNRGVVMFQIWVLVGLLITAIQSIVWRDTVQIIAPVFCDISSHLAIGLTVGIPACSFVITRRLWLIVSGDSPMSESHKLREVCIDYFLGIGVPVLSMILYYIVQGVRFQIVEDYGCASGVYQSGVAILLLDIWPLLFPLASAALYCWRIVRYLRRHTRTVHGVVRIHGGMERSQYVRVLALGCVDIILSLPVGIISFVLAIGVGPEIPIWPGWSAIHTDWQAIATPADEWLADPWFRFRIYWNSWVNVFFGIAIFVLFGLNRDSRKLYGRVFGTTKDSMQSAKAWTASIITSTLVPPSMVTIEIRPQSRESLVEKKPRHEDAAELDTLNDLESGFAHAAITVDIEVGEEIYRPGGATGVVQLYEQEKPRDAFGNYRMV